MAAFTTASLVGSPVFEAGGAWLPIEIQLPDRTQRTGAYVRADDSVRRIHELDELPISCSARRRLNRELLIELDCDLTERTEFCFYLAGGIFHGKRATVASEARAYASLVREMSREIGLVAFHIPDGAHVGLALFREPPARESLRELASSLFGKPYHNVFEKKNARWPRIIRVGFSEP